MIRGIVGQSAIEVTMTIYGHFSLEEKRKALGKLGWVSTMGHLTGLYDLPALLGVQD